MLYARIASRVFNVPLLLAPDVAHNIGDYVMTRMNGDGVSPDLLANSTDKQIEMMQRKGYTPYIVDSGIAVINISGELVNRGAWIGANSGLTSYEGIVSQIKAASLDASVNGILIQIDSPGGEAAGINDVTQAINAAGKPLWAITNTSMASGGYWIGSSAQRVASVPDGRIGSIGVVWMHLNRGKEIAEKGIDVTVIQAGAKKTQFSSLTALSDDARTRAQSLVTDIYDSFVAHVVQARSLSSDAVQATEAEVFTAKEAKKLGLIDEIASVDQFHASMVKAIRDGASPSSKRKPAASAHHPSPKGPAMSPEDTTYSAADLNAAEITARTEGAKTGTSAERHRISQIMASDQAKGRNKLAAHLALNTETSAVDALSILAASATEQPVASDNPMAAPKNLLAAAMTLPENANPTVGADVGGTESPQPGTKKTQAEITAEQRAQVRSQFAEKTVK